MPPTIPELQKRMEEAFYANDFAGAAQLARQIRAASAWDRGAQRSALSSMVEETPAATNFLAGLGRRMKQIGTLGFGEMAGPDADAALNESTAANIGDFAADALSIFPLVRGAQGLQSLAPRFSSAFPGTASTLSNAVTAGGYAGATTPGSIGERGSAAGLAALMAGGGETLGRGLAWGARGPLAPSRVTPDAADLIAQGVPVPLWKARDSAMLRDMAERGKGYVVARTVINDAEQAAFDAWNRNLARAATPPTPILDDAGNVLRWNPGSRDAVSNLGSTALRNLRGRFDDAYEALYGGRSIPVDTQFRTELGELLRMTKRYYPHLSNEVEGIAIKVRDIFSPTDMVRRGDALTLGQVGVTPGAMKEALGAVEDAISAAWRSPGGAEKAEALGGIKQALLDMRHRGLPPEVQSMASEINSAYTNFKQLERALSLKGAQRAGMVSPDQLLGAIRALDNSPGKSAFARGNMPNQAAALRADRVLGSRLPETGPGTAEKYLLAGMFTSPSILGADLGMSALAGALISPMGQRALLGQYGFQPALAGALRRAAPYAGQAAGVLAP